MTVSTSPKAFKADSPLVTRVHPAINVEKRRGGAVPRLVILHYTGMSSAEKAIDWLAREESRVSCHYVIDEQGRITQLVPEKLRAWHAGVSYWQGETDINSCSIGIEIHNPGHSEGYPEFPRKQIDAVVALTRDICERHGIPPHGVLGHSDVAISRKIDPGEKFPWGRLARRGIGHWVRPARLNTDDRGFGVGESGVEIDEARGLLRTYGYDVQAHGAFDEPMRRVVEAFQRHFRPERYDGRLDRSTLSTLRRLVGRMSARSET